MPRAAGYVAAAHEEHAPPARGSRPPSPALRRAAASASARPPLVPVALPAAAGRSRRRSSRAPAAAHADPRPPLGPALGLRGSGRDLASRLGRRERARLAAAISPRPRAAWRAPAAAAARGLALRPAAPALRPRPRFAWWPKIAAARKTMPPASLCRLLRSAFIGGSFFIRSGRGRDRDLCLRPALGGARWSCARPTRLAGALCDFSAHLPAPAIPADDRGY